MAETSLVNYLYLCRQIKDLSKVVVLGPRLSGMSTALEAYCTTYCAHHGDEMDVTYYPAQDFLIFVGAVHPKFPFSIEIVKSNDSRGIALFIDDAFELPEQILNRILSTQDHIGPVFIFTSRPVSQERLDEARQNGFTVIDAPLVSGVCVDNVRCVKVC